MIMGFIPINSNFELSSSIGASTANAYTIAAHIRPKFGLPVGELYCQSDIWYNAIARNLLHDLSSALGMGYRFDYLNLYIGCGMRILTPMYQDAHSLSKAIIEPYNVVYQIDVFVRPTVNRWNLYFSLTNISETQMYRTFEPQLLVNVLFRIDTHWTVYLGGQYQCAGLMNLTPTYYGHRVQTKVTYSF